MPVVHIHAQNYQLPELKKNLDQAAQGLGGWEEILAGRKRILLKPNLVLAGPMGALRNTHTNFIIAMAELLLDRGCEVGVGESPSTGSARQAFHHMGALDDLVRLGVEIVEFKKKKTLGNLAPGYPFLGLAQELDDWEGVINLPKLKAHQQSVFSGATKNLYGCVPGKLKAIQHFTSRDNLLGFMTMIHMVAQQVAPIAHFADGIEILTKNGPIDGECLPLGSILASRDGLALDWVFCRRVGLNPLNTPLFMVASPTEDPSIIGEPLTQVEGFVVPEQQPIRFRFFHILGSVVRGIKAQLFNR